MAAAPEAGRLRLLLPPRALSRNLPERAARAGAPSPDPSRGPSRRQRALRDVLDNQR